MVFWRNSLTDFSSARPAFLQGKSTPRAYLDRCIEAIDRREKDVRAFVTLDLPAARKAADEATARYRAGKPRSMLDGCPVGIKDMINTKDLPTQMNSPLYKGWQAPVDAACVQALRSAGAIILGKTVTTEFACGHTNAARNPHDPARTPGGSSSGSGASVGGGMIPVALGTQTRGSLLRPAAYCGAYALKPTLHVIHTGGVHPLSPTFDHVGIIAASLADAWHTTQVCSSVPGGYSGHRPLPLEVPAARKPKAVGWLAFKEFDKAGRGTQAGANAILEGLARAGVTIVRRENSPAFAELEDDIAAMIDGESLELLGYEMAWPFLSYPRAQLDARIHDLIDTGAKVDEARYHLLLANRNALRARVAGWADTIDVFLSLGSTGPAPVGHATTGSRHYQVPWTFLGLPSMSLPLLAEGSLPAGFQVMGFANRDPEMVAAAAWVETLAR
ncbi:MAG: amidase [Alphaproteobacteria bacterium]|nr:amidase [Alphaproteobacteria bacterium]